nr:MAG: YopX protein [Bacteriophage sp.]
MKIGNIKFKAKQLNSGKWFEGDLVRLGNRVCIGGDHIKDGITDVDPSTVCQFTGLKDFEGNEIWEGDIVHDSYDLLCIDNLYEVVYIEEEGTFAFKSLDKVDNYEPFVNLFEVYVIGNKFDKEK